MHSNTTAIKKPWGLEWIVQQQQEQNNVQTKFHWIQIDFDFSIELENNYHFIYDNNVSEQFLECYWNNRILELTRKQYYTYARELYVIGWVCMCVYLVCKTDPYKANIHTCVCVCIIMGNFSILSINTRETETCPSRADN